MKCCEYSQEFTLQIVLHLVTEMLYNYREKSFIVFGAGGKEGIQIGCQNNGAKDFATWHSSLTLFYRHCIGIKPNNTATHTHTHTHT